MASRVARVGKLGAQHSRASSCAQQAFELRSGSGKVRVVFAARDEASLHSWVDAIRGTMRDCKMALFARSLQSATLKRE